MKQTFRNIQALRAVAALSVVAFHATYIFWDVPLSPGPDWWPLPPMHYVGLAGVDIFFVISGFVIYMVCSRTNWPRGTGFVTIDFAFRRLARIYPIYWVFWAACAAVMLSGITPPGWSWTNVHRSFFLMAIPNGIVQQAWTLTYELTFYAVASFALLLGPTRYRIAIFSWIAFEIILTGVNHFVPINKGATFFNPIVVEFGMGWTIGWMIERKVTNGAGIASMASLPFFLCGGYLTIPGMTIDQDYRVITFGIGAAFIVYAACVAEIRGLVAPRWLRFLGDASYSIYLAHVLALDIVRYIMDRAAMTGSLNLCIVLVVALLAAVGLGVASYILLERPLLSRMRTMQVPFWLGTGGAKSGTSRTPRSVAAHERG